jgi:hypothetical protein
MQRTNTTHPRPAFNERARVVERTRGTAHPTAISMRDRVAWSLMVRPDDVSPAPVRRR